MPRIDDRCRDWDWCIPKEGRTWEHAQAAILMDIRDELKELNRLLQCENFTTFPKVLRDIRRNTTKRKRKRT